MSNPEYPDGLVGPLSEIGTDGECEDSREIDPTSGVKRGLKTRHLSMMALAGIIGPGLLVGAGGALASGGPASLLIGFAVIGIIAFSIMQSLGELTQQSYASGGINGTEGIGFKYWHEPGPFVEGFRGVATVFVFCSTFYAGCEFIAVAATETKNPRVAVPHAIRQVFWRIIFIYLGSAFFFGLTCPSNAEYLVNGGSRALQSPMTIAIQNAGWEGGVHLINAFILITCISAINSSIYIASRTILFMAQDGKAPKFLGGTNKRGVPVAVVVFTNACGALSLMNISTGASRAYSYIVNLSGVATFLVWGGISFTHIRFRSAWKAQGYREQDLPFVSFWYPWNAYFGLGANIFLAFVQGWTTLSPFDAGNFVDAYILLPLFPFIYLGFKLVFRTRFWRAEEIDLQSGRRRDLDEIKELTTGELGGHQTLWQRFMKNL
ncbi:amino acid permease-domain-containing protein [Pseudomassariella vexata]|uniref:Amino acid permease-domain-containing protein n=1 Tax=Pseudomassariella vexata TaxID=1141098 RepID=A0A1Y2E4F6_9PEZI|nr:amino acid permease-domain-containing protein [Pseudomassariella vexata]ORY66176.1 amino acid permease-domain-containing protein [Pseudomassariella vexata]